MLIFVPVVYSCFRLDDAPKRLAVLHAGTVLLVHGAPFTLKALASTRIPFCDAVCDICDAPLERKMGGAKTPVCHAEMHEEFRDSGNKYRLQDHTSETYGAPCRYI